MNTIADALRSARKQANLTQQQLSTHYSIPTRTLCDWETNKRVPPEYVVNLLLRCLELDFPHDGEYISVAQETDASEAIQVPKQPEPTKKLAYFFCNAYGKLLAPNLAEIARQEFEAGRVQKVEEVDEEEEPIENKLGKLFICTNPDPERGIEFGFEFRVKEV